MEPRVSGLASRVLPTIVLEMSTDLVQTGVWTEKDINSGCSKHCIVIKGYRERENAKVHECRDEDERLGPEKAVRVRGYNMQIPMMITMSDAPLGID